LSFVSTAVLAVLTNRSLAVNSTRLDNLFLESKWPLMRPWDVPNGTRYHFRLRHDDTETMHALLCNHPEDLWHASQVVVVTGNVYFLPILAKNHLLQSVYRDLIAPLGSEPFPALFNFFLQFRPKLLKMAEHVWNAIYANSSTMVGLHVRSFEDIHDAPARVGTEVLRTFKRCAIRAAALRGVSKQSSAFFMATDSPQMRAAMRQIFPRVLFSDAALDRFSPKSEMGAMVDVLILSRADALVITGGSTFGYLAATARPMEMRPFVVFGSDACMQEVMLVVGLC